MPKFVVCLTTVAKKKDAERLSTALVRKKCVACVNVLPITASFYHWKNKLCKDSEYLLLMKTSATQVKRLERELTAIHPYECPEFIVLPILNGSKKYLEWIAENVG